jgi:phytoene dehydrogenase-like protein
MSNDVDSSDVIIIGGGLAGLTTAALLARGGKTVTLFERSSKEIGGRARIEEVAGFYFNQGPHALCLTDATDSILKEIGITFTGGIAGAAGKAYLISGGRKREVPGDYGSWLSSVKSDGSLVESDEIQFFNSPTKIDFSQLEGVTVQEWLDKNIDDANLGEIIKTILRLNTYANDPDIQSIGSALRQIYVASRSGYMYLDGGWQTLVDGLLKIIKNTNVRIVMGEKVTNVKRTDSSIYMTFCNDGFSIMISAILRTFSSKSLRTFVSISRVNPCACFLEKYRTINIVPIIPSGAPKPMISTIPISTIIWML